jgi:hypothetical protein
VRQEARVNGDVHGGHARRADGPGASRFLTGPADVVQRSPIHIHRCDA